MVYHEVSLSHRMERDEVQKWTGTWWFFATPTPLKNMSSSVGIVTVPIPMTDPAGAGIFMLT